MRELYRRNGLRPLLAAVSALLLLETLALAASWVARPAAPPTGPGAALAVALTVAGALAFLLAARLLAPAVRRLAFLVYEIAGYVAVPVAVLFVASKLLFLFGQGAAWTAPAALALGGLGWLLTAVVLGLVCRRWWTIAASASRLRALVDEASAREPPEALRRLSAYVEQDADESHGPVLLTRGSPLPGLRSQPWYDPAEMPWMPGLLAAFEDIAAEAREVMKARETLATPYYYPGVGARAWTQFVLFRDGKPIEESCARCPRTAKALQAIPGATHREAMFSILGPGGRIGHHRDPGNSFLTCHLGLVVPPGGSLRVGGFARTWREGECLVFDTSYEHEASNPSTEPRLVLLFDFWHPDLTDVERELLTRYDPA